jgi:signal peptide peptidase SppA
MRGERLYGYVTESLWAITRPKWEAIMQFAERERAGVTLSAEDVKAIIGNRSSSEMSRSGAVAILPLHGVVAHRTNMMNDISGATSTERFSASFGQLVNDDAISAIVIDVDSPGGTIAGVTELANQIYAARGKKPIVAQVNALGASAAYWIAAASSEVISTPSGDVGSIGIITGHMDDSKEQEAKGRTLTVISAGRFKADGHGPLTEDAKARVQARVDRAYGVMVGDIAKFRGVKIGAVTDGFGEGDVVDAEQAKALGMIDGIATMDQTIARLTGRTTPGGFRAETSADADLETRLRLELA